jgi:hypothetical protein
MRVSYVIRNLREDEVNIPIEWAREEGWNPGLHDGACHYPVDPSGWFCADYDGEVIGVGVATNYDETFCFGGFYIVKDNCRHHGIGWDICSAIFAHAGDRNFGVDGVYEMQDKYTEKMGLRFAYRISDGRGLQWERQPTLVLHRMFPLKSYWHMTLIIFPVERKYF